MKLFSRLVVSGLALALALSLMVTPAQAAAKKKKTTHTEERHHSEKAPINGLNQAGKPGYFFSDTAMGLQQGQIAGAAHITFDTWGNTLNIPVGVSYGITDKILVNVNTAFYSFGGYTVDGINAGGGASGLSYLNFGGKYSFGKVTNNDTDLKVAAGLDLSIGPLSNNGGAAQFGFDPYGVVTWTLPDGLQFNGRLGIFVSSISETETIAIATPPYSETETVSASFSYWQLDLGAAYPFDRNLTGIAELATNGVYGIGNTTGGTPLLVGIRTGKDVQLQAMAGLDLGGIVGLYIGGGVALFSE